MGISRAKHQKGINMQRLSLAAWVSFFIITIYWLSTLGLAYHDAMTRYINARTAQIALIK
jgi:hypothetical protein